MGVTCSGACYLYSGAPCGSAFRQRRKQSAEKTPDHDVDASIHGGPAPITSLRVTAAGAQDLDASIHGHMPPTPPAPAARPAEEQIQEPGAFIEESDSVDTQTKALSQRGSFIVAG